MCPLRCWGGRTKQREELWLIAALVHPISFLAVAPCVFCVQELAMCVQRSLKTFCQVRIDIGLRRLPHRLCDTLPLLVVGKLCCRCPKATHGAHGFSRREEGEHRGFQYGQPLGTPCDDETRWWRRKAHEALDPLWRSGENNRSHTYRVLAALLGMLECDVHIARFSKKECVQVIEAINAMTAAAQLPDE